MTSIMTLLEIYFIDIKLLIIKITKFNQKIHIKKVK